jgi:hypothetical protein
MNDDSDESNNSGLYFLFFALIIIGLGVAYARLPAFRGIADAKAPWFKEKVGHYLVSSKPGDAPDAPGGGDAPAPGGTAPDGANQSAPFTIATFEAHPESWPKTLALKKPTEFPAVLDNKKVGTVTAPAGAQVHLVDVKNGRLGVEYQGGGAWLMPDATDLKTRIHFAAAP